MKSLYNEMDKILPQTKTTGALWLGNIKAAQNIVRLNQENIKTVLTIANNSNLSYPQHQRMRHKVFEIKDNVNVNILDLIEITNKYIEESLQYGSVLVHCMAGISRSVSCVLAYLIHKNNWDYEQAFQFVKSKRNCSKPNEGFKKQLIQYAEQKLPKSQNKDDNQQKLLNDLRRKLYLSPDEIVKKTQLVKSPYKQITSLNQNSTAEEKQQYRQQMAQKLFVSTFFKDNLHKNTYSLTQNKIKSGQPVTKRAQLSMYHSIQESDFGFLSERFNKA
ncbi:unnamed protein product [Paramecium primaurelia]|uniref:protein-tyrosine-phosphatase n=1 Tax=Paramecium primaurelia TaxID=5886 RepID=A0A8S1NV91_PARPR|nr:unnamed protein product [Paramecium primaurelia]CAD8091036.1 unnamed protein product [Paramecium primaurelia]